MLLVSIMLWLARTIRDTVRWWGAALGLVPGVVMLIASTSDDFAVVGRAIAMAAAPVGATLGWLLAPVAMRTGRGSAAWASISVAAAAVLIGSFVVSATVFGQQTDPNAAFANTMTGGLFGLLLLGLPMFVTTLPIAYLWVVTLRQVVRLRATRREPATGREDHSA
jgi:hypothetical protein